VHPHAKIEPLTEFYRFPKQPLQSPSKIRSLADIRFSIATLEKNCRRSRGLRKKTVVAIPRECQVVREHKLIVMTTDVLLGYLKNSFIGAAVALAPG
jgi:hypothetical protein